MRNSVFFKCLCDGPTQNALVNNEKESGYDRLKRMYCLDNYGMVSPEMEYLIQTASTTVILSAAMGAVVHMVHVKEKHFRQNTAAAYESQHLARRHLTDTMTLNAFKGAAKYSLKYGTFSSAYLLCTMSAANYMNKITIWEHIGTGALLGAAARINFGLKGMAAAASVGGFLGCLAGGILVTTLWLSNYTLEDLRSLQYESCYETRKQRYKKS